MRVVIAFESMFGNTAALAGEVMAGLTDGGAEITLADVASTGQQVLSGCDLVVLAAPTHALGLSRPASRAEAVTKGADPAQLEAGLREWLTPLEVLIHASSKPPAIAVFDTRVRKARHFPGSAARSAARHLATSGVDVVDRASFYVEGVTGPITPGERDRARAWGHALGETVQHASRERDLRSDVLETSDPVVVTPRRPGSPA